MMLPVWRTATGIKRVIIECRHAGVASIFIEIIVPVPAPALYIVIMIAHRRCNWY